ncbi:MAG: TIGR03915 family putative DNA repair protein, partial [bacterium]|nr:TIGR03915 family putative DNA repair protein [bacterium]
RIMEKAVNRDVHKFHAFVRFRKVEIENDELFVAWHDPEHFTVERATPFFARRFGTMKFSILTPKGSAHWDRSELTFSPAATREMASSSDETEEFWRLYYRSIFNPFRLNIKAMKKELPVRHWPTLPEAPLIAELVREAQGRS